MKKFLFISLTLSTLFADNSVVANGLNTVVNFKDSNYVVNGGIKKGDNLFFSFEKLSINSGESLSFNDANIKNSISRVSGEASFIDGSLTSYAKNFYLLNPNGIVISKNAKLNLSGSIHLSTADYLKFSDESIFYSNPLKSSILTSASPVSFGFLDDNFGSVTISGQGDITGEISYLQEESKKGVILNSGENLNIVAGEIILENGTFSNVGLLGQDGKPLYLEQNILIDKNGNEIPPELYGKVEAIPSTKPILDKDGNKILLIQRAPLSNIKVSEGSINLIATNSSGEINLNTLENSFKKYGDIKIDDFSISVSESFTGNSNANMNINILADDFLMDKSFISLATKKANSSEININANDINILNGSNIVGITSGEAKGATINLSSQEDTIFSGENEKIVMPIVAPKSTSFISSSTQSIGSSGNIKIEAKNIIFSDGAGIDSTSFNLGNAGDIILKAKENINFSGESKSGRVSFIQGGVLSNLENSGDGGNIYIEAKNINFSDGAKLLASMRGGDGVGGKIQLNAKDSITLDGFEQKADEYFYSLVHDSSFDRKSYQYSSISLYNSDKTKGGSLTLNAPNIYILNGAFINSANLSEKNPNQTEIYAENLILDKIGVITSATSSIGNGGDIKVEVENLKLNKGSSITSRSQTESNGGDAGTIDITTNKLTLKDDSLISTEAKDAGGGHIKVDSEKLFHLENSKVTTSVNGGDGNGGNVDIAKPTFSVLNSSLLYANAYEGDGGNINISARDFLESTDSTISASSKFGRDGEINIKAVEVDVSSVLANLPTNFLDISKWKKTPCEKKKGSSSFIIEQKEGLPLMIDDYQPIPLKAE